MEENGIYECEIMLKNCNSNYQQQKKTGKNIFLKTAVTPIKMQENPRTVWCHSPCYVHSCIKQQAGGCWKDNWL